MAARRAQAGQSTVEYLALVALLAILLGAALAIVAIGAPGVANAVVGQVRHALCIVTGERCAVDGQRPCVVASRRETRRIAVNIVVVRLSTDRYFLRERLSDGTVRLTVYRRYGGGVEVGVGARLEIGRGREAPAKPAPVDLTKPGAPDLVKRPQAEDVVPDGRRRGVSGEARAGIEGVYGTGKVFVASSDAEAERILRAVEDGDGPQSREVFYEGGVHGLARAGFGGLLAGGQLEGLADTMLGVREDRESGDVTVALSFAHAGAALLSAALAGPAGAFDDQVVLGVTLDRERRSVALSVMASGGVAGGGSLPPGIGRALGLGADPDADQNLAGRRWEAAARLDLTDPEVAASWADFRRDPANPATIAALGRQLARRATLDVRSYATDGAWDGFAAGLGAGIRLGGEIGRFVDRARLLRASTRPPGGLWEQRIDCLAAVA